MNERKPLNDSHAEGIAALQRVLAAQASELAKYELAAARILQERAGSILRFPWHTEDRQRHNM